MESKFANLDFVEDQRITESQIALPFDSVNVVYSGQIKLIRSEPTFLEGTLYLLQDRLCFVDNQSIYFQISVKWKLLEPFYEDDEVD
jgi:hypothetical protein